MYQHSTSGAAYKEILPKLNEKQKKVYEAISSTNPGRYNDQLLAEYLNWPINAVTPRRGELQKKGLIYEVYKAIYGRTGRRTSFWAVSNKQLNLF